jgi:hypothetical protein
MSNIQPTKILNRVATRLKKITRKVVEKLLNWRGKDITKKQRPHMVFSKETENNYG